VKRKGGPVGRQRLIGEQKKLYLMRAALTRATSMQNLGGTTKSGVYAPKPITLPKLPWSDKPEEKA
jgi:hypothetical protein